MNPIGATICSILLVMIFVGSRRIALLGMIGGVLWLTQVQAIQAGGLNLFAMRILELAGFARVMARGEFKFSNMSTVDRAFIWLFLFTPIVYCMNSALGQAYIIGESVDAFFAYFTFRGLIQELDDMKSFLRLYLILLLPYTAMVILEAATKHNTFTFIGGGMGDWVRNGRLRCVGTFRNPDLLGTLGAVFVPLYVAMFCMKGERLLATVGLVCSIILIVACNSGGPLSAAAAGIVGWALWPMRGKMQIFRRGLVAFFVLAAIMMKAPVWYLIARVSEYTGGDGFHRADLINVSYQHLGLWWFDGMDLSLTEDWFPDGVLQGTGYADITNQFISFGLNAGIFAIVLFILVLKRAYSRLNAAFAAIRSMTEEPPGAELLLWGMGAMVAVHIVNWFGITYFDQSYVIWYMQLAAVTSISESCIKAKAPETSIVLVEPEASTVFMGLDEVSQ